MFYVVSELYDNGRIVFYITRDKPKVMYENNNKYDKYVDVYNTNEEAKKALKMARKLLKEAKRAFKTKKGE